MELHSTRRARFARSHKFELFIWISQNAWMTEQQDSEFDRMAEQGNSRSFVTFSVLGFLCPFCFLSLPCLLPCPFCFLCLITSVLSASLPFESLCVFLFLAAFFCLFCLSAYVFFACLLCILISPLSFILLLYAFVQF